jgi:hypothetical protein
MILSLTPLLASEKRFSRVALAANPIGLTFRLRLQRSASTLDRLLSEDVPPNPMAERTVNQQEMGGSTICAKASLQSETHCQCMECEIV